MELKYFVRVAAVCMVVVTCVSCGGNHKPHHKHKMTFFDSIANKMTLSVGQLSEHTRIGSKYFSSETKFMGDTIYYPTSKFILAVIKSYNPVGGYTFLTVYDRHSKVNTACHLIAMDFDEDYSTSYTQLWFKIFNNEQFFTRQVDYLRSPGKKIEVVVKDSFFQIDAKGAIDSLRSAPSGVRVPVYVQPDDIDDTDDDSLNKKP